MRKKFSPEEFESAGESLGKGNWRVEHRDGNTPRAPRLRCQRLVCRPCVSPGLRACNLASLLRAPAAPRPKAEAPEALLCAGTCLRARWPMFARPLLRSLGGSQGLRHSRAAEIGGRQEEGDNKQQALSPPHHHPSFTRARFPTPLQGRVVLKRTRNDGVGARDDFLNRGTLARGARELGQARSVQLSFRLCFPTLSFPPYVDLCVRCP